MGSYLMFFVREGKHELEVVNFRFEIQNMLENKNALSHSLFVFLNCAAHLPAVNRILDISPAGSCAAHLFCGSAQVCRVRVLATWHRQCG